MVELGESRNLVRLIINKALIPHILNTYCTTCKSNRQQVEKGTVEKSGRTCRKTKRRDKKLASTMAKKKKLYNRLSYLFQ